MSSPQEQYVEALRTSQEAVVQAMESWTKSAQSAFGQAGGSPAAGLEPNQVIDQVFDFAERMLEVQREFSKTLAASAASAAEAARNTAETTGEAVRAQAEAATAAASTGTRATTSGGKRQSRTKKR